MSDTPLNRHRVPTPEQGAEADAVPALQNPPGEDDLSAALAELSEKVERRAGADGGRAGRGDPEGA